MSAKQDEAMEQVPGFDVVSQLGSGGFGDVWLARQHYVDRKVAIKIGYRQATDEQLLKRFKRECEALGMLGDHPTIVNVYAAGLLENKKPYLALEYIANGTYWDLLTSENLGEAQLVEHLQRLGSALAFAHSREMLHRDIKPANILMRGANPVLSDFGIVKFEDQTATAVNNVTASLLYSAPEVLSGEPATQRSDIYSLGATVYAAATQAAPFTLESDESLKPAMKRILTGDKQDLTRLGFSAFFAETIDKMMAPEASERFTSASAFLEHLQSATASDANNSTSSRILNSNDAADGSTVVLSGQTAPNAEESTKSSKKVSAFDDLDRTTQIVPAQIDSEATQQVATVSPQTETYDSSDEATQVIEATNLAEQGSQTTVWNPYKDGPTTTVQSAAPAVAPPAQQTPPYQPQPVQNTQTQQPAKKSRLFAIVVALIILVGISLFAYAGYLQYFQK